MYQKYNAVLRAKSGDAFLIKGYKDLCFGNQYVSTIHSINSCIIKLSKLTVAGTVYRGVCYGKMPDKFWTASSEGIMGGVEFGFQCEAAPPRRHARVLEYKHTQRQSDRETKGCGAALSTPLALTLSR
jgi:hypothetical protein